MIPLERYKGVILSGVSGLLIAMLLIPMGLKLEHAYSFHAKTKECKHSKTHIHAENSHDDFLDYYFQPLVDESSPVFNFKTFEIKNIKVNFYQHVFYSKPYKGLGLRAPPVLLFS